MTEFTYTILSSVPREEIMQYFHQISPKINNVDEYHVFIGVDCKVMLENPRTKKLGHFTIQHTPVNFIGVKASVLHQVELFRLNFLSAGG